MRNLNLVFIIAAFVCFVIAAVWPPYQQRLIAAGLACWVATLFLV